jgi:deoxyadenosine/deoxycytidine kinase
MNGNKLYIIDGNIGSGKSSILKFLKEKSNEKIIFLQEPVNEWIKFKDENGIDIIQKFYENQEKYSFSFQMLAYISRLNILKTILKNNKDCIIVSERSLITDKEVFAKMLYDDGKIEKINYLIYLEWFDSFSDFLNIFGIIYINTDPSVCYERIKKRERSGENLIPLEYLIKCDLYHKQMLKNNNYSNILEINGNIENTDENEYFEKVFQNILNFLS